MKHERLVKMANEIALFFKAYPQDDAVTGVAEHIRQFWDPRMRAGLRDIVAAGGEGLSPIAMQAARQVAGPPAT